MRRLAWFLWMLLALLPLQGWAIAGTLADHPVTSSHSHRVEPLPCPVHGASPAMRQAGQAVTGEQAAAVAEALVEADCSVVHASQSCGACPAAAALGGPPPSSAAMAGQQAPPVWRPRGFLEADIQRLFRPPRS